MSTTALHILELMKDLPPAEREFLRSELSKTNAPAIGGGKISWERTKDGGYYNPDGIPNDNPIFKILEDVEAERHCTLGPLSLFAAPLC